MTLLDLAEAAGALPWVAASLVIGLAAGTLVGRYLILARDLDAAAAASAERLRTAQLEDDRGSLRSLPPTVTVSDALEHASRLGISVAEAADDLYRRRVRALLDREIRRRRTLSRRDS